MSKKKGLDGNERGMLWKRKETTVVSLVASGTGEKDEIEEQVMQSLQAITES